MPIELHPLTDSDADVDAHLDIMWASFGPDLMSVFYPKGMSASDRAHMKADTLKAMRKQKPSEQILYFKAVDTELPAGKQIVSTAKWQLYACQRSDEELDLDAAEGSRDAMFSEGANVEAMKAFFAELAENRRTRFGGEPYMLLSVLVVHPDHQRRGLGALQLQHGLKKADELGVQAFLESSPKGKGLYAKYGFKEEGGMKFDAREFGRAEDVPHTYMVRPAKAN